MNRKNGLTQDMLVIFYCYVVVRVLNNVRVGNSKAARASLRTAVNLASRR